MSPLSNTQPLRRQLFCTSSGRVCADDDTRYTAIHHSIAILSHSLMRRNTAIALSHFSPADTAPLPLAPLDRQ